VLEREQDRSARKKVYKFYLADEDEKVTTNSQHKHPVNK